MCVCVGGGGGGGGGGREGTHTHTLLLPEESDYLDYLFCHTIDVHVCRDIIMDII